MDWLDLIGRHGPLLLAGLGVFVLGTVVGSLLNVCALRLPTERSILWPNSHCFSCLRPVAKRDNVPVVGYWLVRGRCRHCGERFSVRYSLVELATGLLFAGLFYLEAVANWHDVPALAGPNFNLASVVPLGAWAAWLFHAVLLSFLIVAALCDIDHRIIPLSVTVPGTVLGLVGSALLPWPLPHALPDAAAALAPPEAGGDWPGWWALPRPVPTGAQPWPFWGPLPDGFPPGHWLTGLTTGLVGAAFGTFFLRGARALFSKALGREALGLGDADLMMMAGAFLGWQPVLVAFFVGALAAVVLSVPYAVFRGESALPFGPGLVVGLILTWVGWPWLGPPLQPVLFDPMMLGMLAAVVVPASFALAWLVGRLRGPVPDDDAGAQQGG